jgi:hypothetical protein
MRAQYFIAGMLAVFAVVVASPTSRADDDNDERSTSENEFSLSAGASVLGTSTQPYVGDTIEIQRALGSRVTESGGARITPVLTQALWFGRREHGEWTLGIQLTERWWSVWARGESTVAPASGYSIENSVLAIDAALMASYMSRRGFTRFVIGAGPLMNRIGLTEKGWLGDSDRSNYVLGGRIACGPRFGGSGPVAFALDGALEWFTMPQRNDLIRDGGSVITASLSARVEFFL